MADEQVLKSANYIIETIAKDFEISYEGDVKAMLERLNKVAID